jgi:hypothetical protein
MPPGGIRTHDLSRRAAEDLRPQYYLQTIFYKDFWIETGDSLTNHNTSPLNPYSSQFSPIIAFTVYFSKSYFNYCPQRVSFHWGFARKLRLLSFSGCQKSLPQEVKRRRYKACHCPQTTAEVMNAWSHTSPFPYAFMPCIVTALLYLLCSQTLCNCNTALCPTQPSFDEKLRTPWIYIWLIV